MVCGANMQSDKFEHAPSGGVAMVMIIRRFQVNWIIQIEGAWTLEKLPENSLKQALRKLSENSTKAL